VTPYFRSSSSLPSAVRCLRACDPSVSSLFPGGFASFSYHRYIPKKGFTGLTSLALVTGTVLGSFALWIRDSRIENSKRIARQQERAEFLKKLDVHLHKKSVRGVGEANEAQRGAVWRGGTMATGTGRNAIGQMDDAVCIPHLPPARSFVLPRTLSFFVCRFLAHVQRQAELDVLAMDKMMKGEGKH
jgi:hypothetical protein